MTTAAQLATGAEEPFWQALLEGRLSLQKCAGCKEWHWPAVWRCSDCGSWEHVWEEVPMRGEIYTWTRTWHPFGGLDALERPFVTLVVALEGGGGARLMGILEGAAEGVAIGQKVVGRVAETEYDGRAVPAIRWMRV
jgi:uncharacterized protein